MYRRDLELAPGPEFRLRRRRSARILSVLLAVAAVLFGAYDLAAHRFWIGVGTLSLAVAFAVQLLQSEMEGWRIENGAVVRRLVTLRGVAVERLPASQIRGVHVAFAKGRARAFIETLAGEEVPLVEGKEPEVRRIADRLSAAITRPPKLLH